VEFKGQNGTIYMTKIIQRQEGQDLAVEKFLINFDAKDLVEVLAYDWEENDDLGNVSISAQIHVQPVFISTVATVEALEPKGDMGRYFCTSHVHVILFLV